jgi:hypothetical protein
MMTAHVLRGPSHFFGLRLSTWPDFTRHETADLPVEQPTEFEFGPGTDIGHIDQHANLR